MKIHVKIQDKTYEVSVGDINSRPVEVAVDGEIFEAWPQELLTVPPEKISSPPKTISHPLKLEEKPGAEKPSSNKPTEVHAPIPGMVVAIIVSVGDQVAYGQELCILEAMKMKNAIRSNRTGIIETIHITNGQQVQQNQILFSFKKNQKK